MRQTKTQVRAAILAARAATTPQQRTAEAAALTRHLLALITPDTTVCAYVPVGSEPGSADLLDELTARGVRVLLPVAQTDGDGVPQPLEWGVHRSGALIHAAFGLREPPPPHLPPRAVAEARTVLVPALAADRAGVRLGRGAGFYDRTLQLASPGAQLMAVVRDDELVDALPHEPHDVRMTHAVTPGGGIVTLGATPGRE
ncbi:5-formyltetrahydrofolate cyclo-ligase [Mycolicibacterium sp. 018/SC-01/001]|uniref:5-formyltetrahydrofolate cyclo-ligase n=1 Tax=Mycolicibacterium sp. 018/SC-01/001 TaxID=2592069 RepID=UPI0011809D9D|nr:5-formyltetrahydrofolate cyclo-ligase [Mycolicibacterium sp. 018/SC-01/001]TRW81999.1 5-formyltetrahydrofolate cyclo-ligase [Mycolicibacterium sp. 018/SC-01/001]